MRGWTKLAALGALAILAGCAAPAAKRPGAVQAPVERTVPYTTSGLEEVIGRTARTLEAAFGKPLLDIREGTARKLQFATAACVLDAYLYPPKGGGEAIVTHVDARRPDGTDFDRASCVAALTRR